MRSAFDDDRRHRSNSSLQQSPKQLWYFVACTIGLAMFLNILSILWAFKRRWALKRSSPPSVSSTGRVSLRRAPAAALTASRILAFRWRIPAVNMTLMEVFLTSMYLMAVLIWEFVHSAYHSLTYVPGAQFLIPICSADGSTISYTYLQRRI